MTLKNKIEKIIEAIKDTKITEIEISSLWGAQKIKLKQGSEDKQSNNIENEKNISPKPSKDLDTKNEVDSAPVSANDIEGEDNNYTMVKAPLVGTFYSSSKPGEPPFVDIGKNIEVGTSICIIEAMKIFNTIESEYKGQIMEVFVNDGEPVEFGQDLFSIKESDV